MRSEQIQRIAEIDFLPHLQLMLGLGHVIEQEFQNQRAAQTAPLDLELGKAHGQVGAYDVVGADKAGILHGLGEHQMGSQIQMENGSAWRFTVQQRRFRGIDCVQEDS